LSTSTAKRIILYRFDRQPVEGIVNPGAYLLGQGVEFITLDGNLHQVPYGELKALCFASESGKPDLFGDHNLFERRPKVPGLWTRFTLRDGDRLDGILSHNLLDWPAQGYLITPPRAGGARQRVFLARAAVTGTELRGVVGAPTSSGLARAKGKLPDKMSQLNMFES